jgi:hypothetical protein
MSDNVNHPSHYTNHPSGVECIQITEHMGFCLGNAIKYIWRADLKGDAIEDLEKAKWYIEREIKRRRKSDLKHELRIETVPGSPLAKVKPFVDVELASANGEYNQ